MTTKMKREVHVLDERSTQKIIPEINWHRVFPHNKVFASPDGASIDASELFGTSYAFNCKVCGATVVLTYTTGEHTEVRKICGDEIVLTYNDDPMLDEATFDCVNYICDWCRAKRS